MKVDENIIDAAGVIGNNVSGSSIGSCHIGSFDEGDNQVSYGTNQLREECQEPILD